VCLEVKDATEMELEKIKVNGEKIKVQRLA
jgi:hypothetical protein